MNRSYANASFSSAWYSALFTRCLPEQTSSALQIEEELIREMVKVALTDPLLSVRGAAFSIIDGLLKWWKEHMSKYKQ